MAIAIKKLTDDDKREFQKFLKTERKSLPELKYSQLPDPHCEVAVIKISECVKINKIKKLAEEIGLLFTRFAEFATLSRFAPAKDKNNTVYLFSGYVFVRGVGKMLIGQEEIVQENIGIEDLDEQYGEFSVLSIGGGSVKFTSDYFGMEPLYYYEKENVFAAANNYHLLLLLLEAGGEKLEMNVKRSRVNVITSGFTFGSPFSADLDIKNCRQNLSYESIKYSSAGGLEISKTSLYDVIFRQEEWDEDVYEDDIRRAKDEIYDNVKAVFEHERFEKVVIDVSGGFDSRIVFATACNLPKRLRKKIQIFSRTSGTPDDMEKAAGITNIYHYPRTSYVDEDTSDICMEDGKIELAGLSRTIGTYTCYSERYLRGYDNKNTIELTGYLGEVVFGYKRCRGELDYGLGDQKLLARLGGCYLWNSVDELKEVFADQKEIINATLDQYPCDCLFKKFHLLYGDSRNRYICGSARNIERNNLRIPVVFSKYALKAKWRYFQQFHDNAVPDEKISLDLTAAINPLLAILPYASNNDDVIPPREHLLNPVRVNIIPDNTYDKQLRRPDNSETYRLKVLDYMDDLEIAKQMLLHLYDYSKEYEPVCLGLHKVLREMEESPADAKTGHAREQLRKIYDAYYQMQFCVEEKAGGGYVFSNQSGRGGIKK